MSNYRTPAQKWTAVRERDPLAASDFVYCVKTTRIYCRPSCSARLARRSNVEFYDAAPQAARAGYRACKRCKPELASWEPGVETVGKACAGIRGLVARGEPVSLERVASASGLSKWHFHRVFRKVTGFTLKEWAGRARRAQEGLDRGGDGGPVGGLGLEWVDDGSGNIPSTVLGDYVIDDADLDINFDYDTPASTSISTSTSTSPETNMSMSMSPGTNTATTPATPYSQPDQLDRPDQPDQPTPSRIIKLAPTAANLSPLYYTVRETNYGHILIGFQDGNVCLLKMGFSAADLTDELEAKFPGLGTSSPSLFEEDAAESSTVEEVFEGYVDAILEALERPSGKTVDVPLNLVEL